MNILSIIYANTRFTFRFARPFIYSSSPVLKGSIMNQAEYGAKFRFEELKMRQPNKSNYVVLISVLAIIIPIFAGCSHREKIIIPPRMDLRPYGTVGIIEFTTNAESDLKQYATQEYIHAVQAAQPGVRMLELGGKDHVLKKVGLGQLDPDAVRAIGAAYRIDVLIFGQLSVSDPKPNVRLSSTWESLKVGAEIEASLMTKLWETDSGVTLWTNASSRRQSVARLKADTGGNVRFGASDPKDSYGRLVPELVYANTTDFRSSYEYRRVK